MAQTTIEAVRALHLIPLIEIHCPMFAASYERGLAWSLFGDREGTGSLFETYVVQMFQMAQDLHLFAPGREEVQARHFGFTFGMVHGGVLLRNGTLHPDVSTLVRLRFSATKRGYLAGREFAFIEADINESEYRTDMAILARLRDLHDEQERFHDPVKTLRFSLGNILGELSAELFPWTDQEHQAWETECVRILGYVEPLDPTCRAVCQLFSPVA
jgi:hypothetical protein